MLNRDLILKSKDVANALATNQAVVALESTVIAHGLPRPQNFQTALRMEQIVRAGGGVPSTCAILDGTLRAGLDQEEIQHVASSDQIKKISIRDLPIALAQNWDGATTVASTAWLAHHTG